MPRSTNDSDEKNVTKRVKKVNDITEKTENKSSKKSTAKKSSTTSKSKKTDEIENKTQKSPTKKSNTTKTKTDKTATISDKQNKTTKTTKSKSKKATKKSSDKKVTKFETSESKTTKKALSTTRKRKSTKKEEILNSLEYYDLPYRYNQTIVKILAQTPNTLFIYWDISDEDRKKLEEIYGNDFFSNTKPVLIIHNETKNYSFEIDINDFANSWYLNITDTDCKYNIELGRRFINNDNISNENISSNINDYIYISSSNKLITPNDHILLSDLKNNTNIQFQNVKTNNYYIKNINTKPILNLYEELYSKEILEDLPFNNPSSSNVKK